MIYIYILAASIIGGIIGTAITFYVNRLFLHW